MLKPPASMDPVQPTLLSHIPLMKICGGHKIAPKQVPTVADGSLQSLKSRLCWVFVFFYGIGMLLEVLRILLGELDPSFPRLLISLDSISTCTCSIVVLVEILDFGKGLAYKVGGKFLKKEGWRAHSQTGLTYRRNSDAHYRFLVGFCPVGCGALVTGRTYRFLAPPADTFTLSLSLSLSLSQLHFLALAVPFHVSFLACVFALAPLLGLPPVYLAVYRSDFTSVLVLLCLVQHSSVV